MSKNIETETKKRIFEGEIGREGWRKQTPPNDDYEPLNYVDNQELDEYYNQIDIINQTEENKWNIL